MAVHGSNKNRKPGNLVQTIERVSLILETDEEILRNKEAKARRRMRLEERKKEKACQDNYDNCVP